MWLPSPSSTSTKPMPPSPVLHFNAVTDTKGTTSKYDLNKAATQLMKFLIRDFNVLGDYPPALIISFDEAHPLASEEKDFVNGPWSKFSELRRALRVVHLYPCFSLFLSTTGKVSQFMPELKNDPSSRVQKGLLSVIPPFCELEFDQLAKKVISGCSTLEDVSSLEFMASLGRPLLV